MDAGSNRDIDRLARIKCAISADSEAQLQVLTPLDKTLMRDLRYVMRENQTQFWRRFGVAQSSGSRFERGMPLPLPLLFLIRLYFLRRIGDQDLQAARSPDFGRGAEGSARRS